MVAGAVARTARRLCSLALLCVAPEGVAAQDASTSRGSIIGLVLRDDSTEAPIAGAEIDISGTSLRAGSSSRGEYRLDGIPPGLHTIRVKAIGFQPIALQVTIGAGDELQRDFLLAAVPDARLDTVTTVAARPRTEFEERMLTGKGQYIDREALDRQRNRRMADVLAHLTGVRIVRNARGEAHAMSSRGRLSIRYNPRCYVHVYVDDAPVYSEVRPGSSVTGEELFNVNSLTPGDVEAVEFYSGLGGIPPRYNRTGSACGVLLFWTRNRR